jgi:predicted nucleic acid-binding protein
MRVYLDMCSIQRPLDTKSQVRIAVEAEAILGLLSLNESGQLDLIASDALMYEAEQNPHSVRKEYAFEVLAEAKIFVRTDVQIEERARALVAKGLNILDALHLASAEAGQADFLCTCDDKFLKRAKVAVAPPTRAVSPLELIAEVGS